MISSLSSGVEAIAVIIASIVAVRGINVWRAEHVGRKRIDTAEEILELFYIARDAISHMRNPGSFQGEGATRKRGSNETEREAEWLDNAYVLIVRYQAHKEEFARLRRLRYRAITYWGTEAAQPFDDFEKIIGELLTASRMLARLWSRDLSNEQTSQQVEKAEAKFWEGASDPDPIAPLVGAMVSGAEALCVRVVGKRDVAKSGRG
jgi:hypothetical protein